MMRASSIIGQMSRPALVAIGEGKPLDAAKTNCRARKSGVVSLGSIYPVFLSCRLSFAPSGLKQREAKGYSGPRFAAASQRRANTRQFR